jgi:hypothetical protein
MSEGAQTRLIGVAIGVSGWSVRTARCGCSIADGPDGRYVAVGRDSAGLDERSGTQREPSL